jgi:hypothetical protein
MKTLKILNGILHTLAVALKYLQGAVVTVPSYLQNIFDVYQQIKCILWSKITHKGTMLPPDVHKKNGDAESQLVWKAWTNCLD